MRGGKRYSGVRTEQNNEQRIDRWEKQPNNFRHSKRKSKIDHTDSVKKERQTWKHWSEEGVL